MGEMDNNDAIPFSDAFSSEEQSLIYELLGKEMMPARWEKCKNIYINDSIKAIITTYENTGHEQPESVKKDILHFFRDI